SGLAFVSDRNRTNVAQLFRMDADGGNQTQLSDLTSAAEPSWSPDGRAIAFTATAPDPATAQDIFTIRPDGTHLQDLTADRGRNVERMPAFSPRGDRIAYVQDGHVWLMDADG